MTPVCNFGCCMGHYSDIPMQDSGLDLEYMTIALCAVRPSPDVRYWIITCGMRVGDSESKCASQCLPISPTWTRQAVFIWPCFSSHSHTTLPFPCHRVSHYNDNDTAPIEMTSTFLGFFNWLHHALLPSHLDPSPPTDFITSDLTRRSLTTTKELRLSIQ